MDPQQLIAALSCTFSPDPAQRHQAESAIATLPTVEGGSSALLQVVSATGQVGREVRQAAAIAFKNITRNSWEPMGRTEAGACVPDASKPPLRDQLFQVLLVEADKSVRDLLAESVNQIARCDYPAKWPKLLPEILAMVQSGDPLRMHNALLALRQVAKRLEYKQKGADRLPLEQIVAEALPLLQSLTRQLLDSQNHTLEAALIMKLCLKVLWSCTQFSLPDVINDPAMLTHLGGWLDLIGVIVTMPLPEADAPGASPPGQPVEVEQRNVWPWWKLKKWALQLLSRWFHRYGMPQYADDESRSFADVFSQTYAPKLLEPVLGALALRPRGQFCTDRVTHLSLVFVESAVQLGSTYTLLKPHVPTLLQEVVFPLLCISDSDVALFETDPLDFVRKQNDPMEDFVDPKMSAMQLLDSVMKYRKKDNLDRFLGFIVEALNEYVATPPAQRNPKKKEGVFVALGCLAELLKKQKKYAAQLEPLLVTHVFPEFRSPAAFLRSRAASMALHFNDIKWSNAEHVSTWLQLMLAALRDPALPVQVEAANGLRCLIELDGTEALLLPVLPDLLNEYFRIMAEIGNDSVVSALESIINKFGNELVPHASLLVQKLCESFLTYATADDDDDDEAAMAACQCVDAVTTVLSTVIEADTEGKGTSTALFAQCQPFLLPVLNTILSPCGDYLEYLESGLEILTFVTYYAKPEGVGSESSEVQQKSKEAAAAAMAPYVALFPAIVHSFHNWAYDYISNMMSPIDNMIGHATDLFLAGVEPTSGQSYVALVLGMAEKVFSNAGRSNQRESVCATHLMLSLLHNAHGRLDAALGSLLNVTFSRLHPQPKPTEVVMRVPEGAGGEKGGQPVPVRVGAFEGTVPCPPNTVPGQDVTVTVPVPPDPTGDALKVALLQTIASAFFYNPVLTFNWLEQAPGRTAAFFTAWCTEMDDADKWSHLPAKLHALGLASIVSMDPDHMPSAIRENLPTLLAKLIHFVHAIDADNAAGNEDDDDDEEDEEGEDSELEDDDDDDGLDGGLGGDAVDAEELAYAQALKKEHKKMMTYALADAEEDDPDDMYGNDDDYSSPIDDVDELLVFAVTLSNASQRYPVVFGAAQASLSPEVQAQAQELMQKAAVKQSGGPAAVPNF